MPGFLVVLLLAFNIPYIPATQVAIKRSTVGCDWFLLFWTWLLMYCPGFWVGGLWLMLHVSRRITAPEGLRWSLVPWFLLPFNSTLLDFQIENLCVCPCELMYKLCSPHVLSCPQTSEEGFGSPLNTTQVLGSCELAVGCIFVNGFKNKFFNPKESNISLVWNS